MDRSARFICSMVAIGVGSTTLPQGSIYSGASSGFALLEFGLWSTATGTKRLHLRRLTSLGTPGAGGVEAKYDDDSAAAQSTCFATHTGAPTLGDAYHRVPSPAANSQGIYQGDHDIPIECPLGTGNGFGFLATTALENADVLFVWDE